MTNDRITSFTAAQWKYCPWCGRALKQDQDQDLLVRNNQEDGFNRAASEKNGFVFEDSVKHCGFDIRIWVPVDDSEVEME